MAHVPPSKQDRLYRIWCSMKSRCNNHNHNDYRYYGGKGITVCKEWSDSFSSFKSWALANGYNDSLTIDRKENSKGYMPENCRWATMQEQNRNKSKVYNMQYRKKAS